MDDLHIKRVTDDIGLDQAFKLREIVFIDEQGIDRDVEFDGLDDACHHLLAKIGDRAVGTLRIRRLDDGVAKIERVVVLKSERGRHFGIKMMAAALEVVREFGMEAAKLHAQTYAKAFYAKLGFVAYGDTFDEDGIKHIAMRKDLV